MTYQPDPSVHTDPKIAAICRVCNPTRVRKAQASREVHSEFDAKTCMICGQWRYAKDSSRVPCRGQMWNVCNECRDKYSTIKGLLNALKSVLDNLGPA